MSSGHRKWADHSGRRYAWPIDSSSSDSDDMRRAARSEIPILGWLRGSRHTKCRRDLSVVLSEASLSEPRLLATWQSWRCEYHAELWVSKRCFNWFLIPQTIQILRRVSWAMEIRGNRRDCLETIRRNIQLYASSSFNRWKSVLLSWRYLAVNGDHRGYKLS